jgi:hypothetical protein
MTNPPHAITHRVIFPDSVAANSNLEHRMLK